jgi:hypothetical protein
MKRRGRWALLSTLGLGLVRSSGKFLRTRGADLELAPLTLPDPPMWSGVAHVAIP